MTGSATYLRRLAVLGAGILFYWLLMSTLPRVGQGILLTMHGLAATGVGATIARRRWRDELGKWTFISVVLIMVTWGLGEIGWSSSFFLFNKSNRAPLVVLTTELGYFLSFSFSVLCMLSAIEGGLRSFFVRRIVMIPLLLTTPIAFRLILDPFLAHRDAGLTAFNLGETMAIAVSYISLNLALLVLISSRSLDWSIFAAGILCLVFGDWAIRVDKITGHRIEFGLASYFILFGLYAASFPFLWRGRIGRIQRFEWTSILNSYRVGLLVVALSMVLVYALYQREGVRTLRILCLGSGIVAFVAVFLSQMMVERIRWFSTEIGRVLRSELEQGEQAGELPSVALPVELREIYGLVFSTTIREQKLRAEQRTLQQIRRLQTQVAHDIRSPLAALSVAVNTLQEGAPEESRRILRSAAGRIRDIANDLVEEKLLAAQDDRTPDAPTVHLLSSLIEDVVSEKCIQRSATMGVQIEPLLGRKTYDLFVAVSAPELKRALSNLIDNAVEAIKGAGKVTIRVTTDGLQIVLSVSDNGEGISEEIRTRLGERGFTHGKSNGNGLGLYHARAAIEKWGGRLSINSTVGAGTTVEIRLPRALAPAWFVEKILLPAGRVVLVLDDDKAIHATWDHILAPHVQAGVEALHFTDSRSLRKWLAQHRDEAFLALIDYELLREEVTGVDIIEQEGIADRSILVTSRFAEPAVIRRSSELGLKIIPKGLVGLVPLVAPPTEQRTSGAASAPGVRVLVIDDDEMIAWAWRKQQNRLGISELGTFTSVEACESAGVRYETFDLAFVDLHIKGTSWKLDETLRYLKARGVKRVFIASGSDEADSDVLSRGADGIAADKVPEDLGQYLATAG